MSQGHPIHLKLLGHVPHEEPHIVTLEYLLLIDEHDKMGRPHLGLDNVINLQGALTVLGQVVHLLELLQPVVQQPGTDPLVPLVISRDDLVHHTVDVLHLGDQELPGFGLVLLFDRLPLIDHNHNRTSLLNDCIDKLEIVHLERPIRVHHIHDDMRLPHMQKRTVLRLP